jgi:TatA/E family protein of Tat protein translocase
VWKEAMFNLGPFELVAIFVVALLVFGPDKLPEMGKQVGRAYREFRKFQESMQTQVRDVMEPITGPITGPIIQNGPVGPAPTNISGGNIPRSATIQNPQPDEGEAAAPPGTFGHYAPVEPPVAGGAPTAGDNTPANGAAPGTTESESSAPDPDAR